MTGLGLIASALLLQAPPSESASPIPLPIDAQPFKFKAVIERLSGLVPDDADASKGVFVEGALSGPRWHLESQGLRITCDGERIWRRDGRTIFLEPISSQSAVPVEAWTLPYLLQSGDKITGRWTSSNGRWTRWSAMPEIAAPSADERRVVYAWNRGGMKYQHAYSFKRIGEKWFLTEYASNESFGDRSYGRSVYRMSEPLVVGIGLCARRLHAQGWNQSTRNPEVLEPASGFVGELLEAEAIEANVFDSQLAAWITIPEGISVLDRTRPAVLRFVAGQRAVDIDGIGYEFETALGAPPNDSELMGLLRTARRKVEFDRKEGPEGTAQLREADGTPIQSSLAVTSGGLRIEPGRRLDLGMVRFGESPTKTAAKFQLRNTGDKTRTIKSVNASCGCTETAVDQKILAPGATATITTTLTVERAKTYHSSIWVAFERDAGGAGDAAGPEQIEELQIVAVGVPEKAIRATALRKDPAGDVLTMVLYSTGGKPEGDVGVPKGAESAIASDSGWLPVGGDAKAAKHWIRDIVKRP